MAGLANSLKVVCTNLIKKLKLSFIVTSYIHCLFSGLVCGSGLTLHCFVYILDKVFPVSKVLMLYFVFVFIVEPTAEAKTFCTKTLLE